MLECLINGEILEHVAVSDRGLNYGDGLFETLPVQKGQASWWQDHMDRLSTGCERLGMKMPPQSVLLRELKTVSVAYPRCIVKIVLTRGSAGRGYHPPLNPEQTRLVSSHPWPSGLEEAAQLGVDARICELKLGIQPALGGIKHLNRLEQVLASREMEGHQETEGILRDSDNHLISAISSNLFMVFRQQLMTPRLDRCGVRGILRGRLLKAHKKRIELRRIAPDMLEEASEVFLAGSVRGIVPVRRIDGIPFPIGPVTRELQQWLSGVLAT